MKFINLINKSSWISLTKEFIDAIYHEMCAFLINNLLRIHEMAIIGNCWTPTKWSKVDFMAMHTRTYFDLLITLMWFVIIISRSRRAASEKSMESDWQPWQVRYKSYFFLVQATYIRIACAKQALLCLVLSLTRKALINISYFAFLFHALFHWQLLQFASWKFISF
jgi:hypothetical protein